MMGALHTTLRPISRTSFFRHDAGVCFGIYVELGVSVIMRIENVKKIAGLGSNWVCPILQ